MAPPTVSVEQALRSGITMYLRSCDIKLNLRPVKIDDTMDLDKLSANQLPACLVYDPKLIEVNPISNDSVQFLVSVKLLMAVNRGNKEVDNANALAELRQTIYDALYLSNGLGAEQFGVFSHSFDISEGERYVSEYGVAKEYAISVTGYHESTGQDKGSIYIQSP
jgi:hypothetical protein